MGKKEVNQTQSVKNSIIEWVKSFWTSYCISICNNFIHKTNTS